MSPSPDERRRHDAVVALARRIQAVRAPQLAACLGIVPPAGGAPPRTRAVSSVGEKGLTMQSIAPSSSARATVSSRP